MYLYTKVNMKFYGYFDDLLNEGKYFSDEKFDWVAKNIGEWIMDSTIEKPTNIRNLPMITQFKEYLVTNTKKPIQTDDDIILATDYLENFLNYITPRTAQAFIRDSMVRFPLVKSKIASYLKPQIEAVIQKRRGRPLGSKNKPKIDLNDPNIKIIKRFKPQEPVDITRTSVSMSEPTPEPQTPEPVQVEPTTDIPTKKMGRPKIFSDEFTAMDRARFKQEGKEYWEYLEAKKKLIDNKIKIFNQQLQKLQSNIDKRKKFWNVE